MRGDQSRWIRNTGLASTIGITLVVATGIGGLIGWFLDERFGTAPWLTLLFGLMGIVAGFIEMFRTVARITRDEEKNDH
ncbi:MAG: AtpZ/AtpI family protein [Armatimonadota bacterium]